MLGLVVGLGIHFVPSLFQGKVSGTVQLRPVWSGFVPVSPNQLADLVRSDDILERTTQTLDLPARWKMNKLECLNRLRSSIDGKPVGESEIVRISVKARSETEAIMIWNQVVATTAGHIESVIETMRRENLMHPEEIQRRDPVYERPPVPPSSTLQDLLHRKKPLHGPDFRYYRRDEESDVPPATVEVVQEESLPERPLADRWPSPLMIHESPDHPGHRPTFIETLRPMLFYGTLGIGAGTALALILAYLLELFFPRKDCIP